VSDAQAVVASGPAVVDAQTSRPLPASVYTASLLGLALGAVVGLAYDALVLGAVGPIIPSLTALVFAAWAQARAVRRAQGRAPATAQRMKLAFGLAVFILAAVGFVAIAVGPTKIAAFGARFELATLTGGALAVFLGGLAAMTLALFAVNVGLVTFFSTVWERGSSTRSAP
jgi:hypothetical protein